jgi:hypothetical protein
MPFTYMKDQYLHKKDIREHAAPRQSVAGLFVLFLRSLCPLSCCPVLCLLLCRVLCPALTNSCAKTHVQKLVITAAHETLPILVRFSAILTNCK